MCVVPQGYCHHEPPSRPVLEAPGPKPGCQQRWSPLQESPLPHASFWRLFLGWGFTPPTSESAVTRLCPRLLRSCKGLTHWLRGPPTPRVTSSADL